MKERRIIDQFCIEELIDSAQNLNLEDIDYTLSMELNHGQKIWFDILGKNHDIDENGNKTNLTLCFHDFPESKPMNTKMTSIGGGWRGSELRTWLNEEFFEQLPDWLQKKIVPVVKKSSEGEKIVETVDKIFIPSEIEVFGKTKFSMDGEGEQYEFFKDWHNRVKGFKEDKYAMWYWLRSPRSGNGNSFCAVSSSGSCDYGGAYGTSGVAPCFSI